MMDRLAYAGVDEYNRKVYVPDPNGTYALMPVKEYERLRKVVDAVRGARNATDNEQFRRAMDVVAERMRELEESDE